MTNDKMTTIFEDDFKDFSIGSTPEDYSYFDVGGKPADDGTVSYNKQGDYLNLDSHFFTTVFEPVISRSPISVLDHVKLLVYKNEVVTLDNDSMIVMESKISGTQNIGCIPMVYRKHITNPHADYRLGGGALNAFDTFPLPGHNPTFIVLDFILSDEIIYFVYERLPFGRKEYGGNGDYQAFTCVVPVAKRTLCDKFTKVSMVLDRANARVICLVNDRIRLTIPELGIPLKDKYVTFRSPGIPERVDLKLVRFGFGTFTILDMSDPAHPSDTGLLQYANKESYLHPSKFASDSLDADKKLRLFSNGFTLRLKYLNVYRK